MIGKSSTASTVTGTITSTTDLTALKDAINSVSGSTGIVATLSSDKAKINVTQDEGYNIIIGDVDKWNWLLWNIKGNGKRWYS